ncbi:kinase-like protein [Aspergillus eucalypticola CBS 122712]|uniref:non-specific serine/threonine protein kinase n=1 Tax=Aspergillus eucalypticola (strain CBS 122712 / IBT 29274) TaxID=1448314 RepID=A0A317UR52_ASPEC|nr:kinase-like protein [Aspergillus eucalypticola CBS 122712]PWY64201.1 kinase-like protein [Aspergillus eucalypticola CBS 122712]
MEPRRHFYRLCKQYHSSVCIPQYSSIAGISYTRPCVRTINDLRSRSEPLVFPNSGWENIDPSFLVEEENVPTYEPEKFYPVRIGEVFNHQYQVVGKLGYGSTATVWLCRDLLPVMSAIVRNPDGHRNHTCLVHPPLGISLDQLMPLLPGKVMSSSMVRTTMRNILAALDFLHTEAHVIHTAEVEGPVPRKSLSDRTIYVSRPLPISFGTPVLCDLGEGRLGVDNQTVDIMPDIYRAPEVILNMNWDNKVDIWNVGMVPKIWDLFEHRHLFKARNDEGKLDDGQHLAEMQAVLGRPPAEFLARSAKSPQFWDANNLSSPVPISDYDLETLEERLEDGEKEDFLRFLRRMLCWLPEERATAKELLFDPWLMHGLFK